MDLTYWHLYSNREKQVDYLFLLNEIITRSNHARKRQSDGSYCFDTLFEPILEKIWFQLGYSRGEETKEKTVEQANKFIQYWTQNHFYKDETISKEKPSQN